MSLLAEIRQIVLLTREDENVDKRIKRMFKDVDIICERGREMGLSQEFIDSLLRGASRRSGLEENFYVSVSYASPLIENPDSLLRIDPEWAEHYRQYSKKTFDEEMQKLWGTMLAGEANRPGTFSKRTMMVFSSMSKEEALAFRKLCEYSTEPFAEPEWSHDPIPILVKDSDGGTYNKGAITDETLKALHAAGLIDTSLVKQIPLLSSTAICFKVGDGVLLAVNNGDHCINLNFEAAVFLPTGAELSRIYDIGSGHYLKEILLGKIEDSGLEPIWIDGND